jgi:ABC-2 type transport system permease protein
MTAFRRLAVMELRLFFREKQAVFWTFLFPVLMIWLFGVMFGKQKVAGMTFSDAYVPSWIAVNLLTTALYTIGTTLTSYRQTGILRRYQATPLRAWAILGSHTVYGLLVFVISALVIVAFGAFAFQLDMPKYVGSTLAALALSVLALFPFGFFMASIAKNARSAAAISSLLLNIMLFLSGATFPLQMMPAFIRHVAKVLPLYYVIDLVRQTWNFTPIMKNGLDVIVLGGMFVLFTGLAARFFSWSAD